MIARDGVNHGGLDALINIQVSYTSADNASEQQNLEAIYGRIVDVCHFDAEPVQTLSDCHNLHEQGGFQRVASVGLVVVVAATAFFVIVVIAFSYSGCLGLFDGKRF